MFDRVNDAISGGGSGEADAEHLDGLLRDGEELQHALANDGTIEHTEDGRTTTIESGGGHGAYMLVTDERVLWVLGDDPEEAEIAFEMTGLKTCHLRKGLLNSKLDVQTYNESVVFDPDEGDAEAAEDYISNVGSSWADMSSALAQARDAIAAYEDACERGADPNQHALAARSQFSQARRCATREDRAPEQKIRAEVEAVVEELAHTRVNSWLDSAESTYETVETALEEDRYGDACEAYVDAAEAVGHPRGRGDARRLGVERPVVVRHARVGRADDAVPREEEDEGRERDESNDATETGERDDSREQRERRGDQQVHGPPVLAFHYLRVGAWASYLPGG